MIPLYTPECRECDYCLNPKTNLCQAIRTTQGQGLDARRVKLALQVARRGRSSSTTWAPRPSPITRSCRKSRWRRSTQDAPFDKVCYIGCGVTTGIGAVINTAKVEPGSQLRGLRPGRHRPERAAGPASGRVANMIVGVDMNPEQEGRWGERFGMTHFVNPKEVDGDLVALPGGVDWRRRRLLLRVP